MAAMRFRSFEGAEPPIHESSPSVVAFSPAFCGAWGGGGVAMTALYQMAYEKAREATRPSPFQQMLTPSWN